jgi:hypothetical protein
MVQSLNVFLDEMMPYSRLCGLGEVLLEAVIGFVALPLELQWIEAVQREVDP